MNMDLFKGAVGDAFSAFLRIALIFLALTMGFDSMTRIYYGYMPVDHWLDFRSVQVMERNGEAVAVIHRKPNIPAVSMFHRTLLIRYPEERRGCTNTTITIVEDPDVNLITVPLSRMLSETCPEVIGAEPVESVLQVSYIFEFPYGVKRFATLYSNRFSLQWNGETYKVAAANP